jgi:YesN/AraC family two-component response regulator
MSLSADKPVLLLVEDNDDVAIYIRACTEDDYQVIRAENGQMGIELALTNVPDLILSDVLMPQKDGFQLCDTLKNDQRTSHIPIILLTARAGLSDRISGLRHGADAYLVKPFQREELTAILANLLQSRRLLQLHYSRLALEPAQPDQPATEPAGSLEDQFLNTLRSAIEGQLDNPNLSIDEICQLMGMGRTALYLKMAALTGMSINKYVRSIRLRKARELLLASAMNISEVAYAVGFEDPKYFSRVFSEEFGITPGNFRLSAQS